jgi:hypothetical protein
MRSILLLLGIMAKNYHSCISFLLPRSCRVYPYGNSDGRGVGVGVGVGVAETRRDETRACPSRCRCDCLAETTRHDGVVVMVVMVAYCCSVPRCHLLHCILTWLLGYYRYDLIYVLRLMPTASFVAMAVVCCHCRHSNRLPKDIYLGHGIVCCQGLIRCCDPRESTPDQSLPHADYRRRRHRCFQIGCRQRNIRRTYLGR